MSKESMPDMVTRYHESSLSQKAFAAAHGLTKGKLHYWIKKLARDNNGAGASFVPLEIVCDAPPAPTCILIRCGNGVEIKIPV